MQGLNSKQKIQKELDRLNRKFHKRLIVERYLELREQVRRTNLRFSYDRGMTVDEYLEEEKPKRWFYD